MPIQSGQNVAIYHKRQSALGTRATGSDALQLPLVPSGGLRGAKVAIEDPSVRSDGMTGVARHGTRSVGGELAAVLKEGALDELFEDLLRADATAAVLLDESDFTSLTTTASTIVAASGSWLTLGVRVGDIVTITNHSTAANNNVRLPVLGVTATTITVPTGMLTLNATPDTDVEVTVAKRFTQGTTDYYRTFEEYHRDIDQSEVYDDCVVSRAAIEMQADDTVRVAFGIAGRNFEALATGSSPHFSGATAFEDDNLVSSDATLYKNGVAIATLTGLSVIIDNAARTQGVVGATVSPDVFRNNTRVTGTISAMREDLSWLEHFADEDELSILAIFRAPGAAPQAFWSIYLPLVKLNESPSAPLGGDGPMISTMAFTAGKKPATTGHVETMVQLSTSAA